MIGGGILDEASRGKRLALAFLTVGAFSFGFSPIFIKLCRYPAPFVASLRLLIAGLVLTPFCIGALRKFLTERGLRGFLLLVLPGLLLAAHFQTWVLGIRQTMVASATFIFSINPVFFALFERFAGRKRVPAYGFVSLGFVLLGAFWVFLAGRGRLGQTGDLLCLASTLLYVVYLLASRRVCAGVPHLLYIHVIYLWGGLLSLPIAMLWGEPAAVNPGDTGSLLSLLGLALLPTLVGHSSSNYGVRHVSPLTVSFFTLTEPVLASAAAALFLGERLRVLELPAYALFLSATLLYLIRTATARTGSGRQSGAAAGPT